MSNDRKIGIFFLIFILFFVASFYFASKNPIRTIVILALNIGPLVMTYMDLQRLPLYTFLWVLGGFGLIALIVSRLLLKDFGKYLPDPDEGLEEE